jgi:SNF2 family DNA or RNA helicase
MEKATINYEHSPESMYHIITYETLRSVFERSYVKRDKEWIISSQGLHRFFLPDAFRVIIFDEVHRLRNKTAKVHHAARFLGATQRADWITPRIGLSGTPVINGFADISNIATVLRFPKRFTETKFFDTLNISTGSDFVTTCFIKHFKSETIELPELVTTFHSLDMSDEERRIHNEYVSKLNLEVVSFNEHRCTTFTDVIVALVRLRQVAIHPDLPAATPGSGAAATDTEDDSEDDSEDVEDDYGDDIEEDDATGNEKEVAARLREKRAAQKQQANKEAARKRRKKQAQDEAARERNAAAREAMHRAKNTWMRSTKLKWLVDRVDTYKQEDRKFLVFTSFSTSAHLVHEVLSERGLNTRLFVGSTTDAARRDAVLDFRAGRLDGLILTFGAGGTGLHLAPTGSAVIHLDATWTPAAHEQAECRLHRYGTTRDVVNDYALLEGSVDAYIIQNVHVKKQAFANALDRMVQHLQAKPVKYNSSSVNMAQVLSLLRWFATMKRQKMYEKQLQELEEEPPFGTSEQNALTAA